MSAVIIQPDGSYAVTSFDDGSSLRLLQTAVGGYIEAVTSADEQLTFWCNEEGKLKGLEINRVATYLWWATAPYMRGQDVLVGAVVITGGAGPEGETLGLDDEQLALIRDYLDGP